MASTIYTRLALSRRKNPFSNSAKGRLAYLQKEGLEKLKQLDDQLGGTISGADEGQKTTSPSELSSTDWQKNVREAFEQYEHLARQYAHVPQAGKKIRAQVARQRARPEYAAVLQEPEARELWRLGHQHEKQGHICCAYLAYQQAVLLLPARSAEVARDRLAKLEQDDPQVVAAAKTCSQLQWCHKTYRKAERLAKAKPKRARELFGQIVERSPDDTEIHRAARLQIAKLLQQG